MPTRDLDPNDLAHREDWEGNDANFECPPCGKVYPVSGFLHQALGSVPVAVDQRPGFPRAKRREGGRVSSGREQIWKGVRMRRFCRTEAKGGADG
jgi:hypothetical protein